ncbi:MAG: dethiobiotin synthase [Rhodothermales bacterium]|nr:dethiobiotin synthase [Rhodothermales bacterium]
MADGIFLVGTDRGVGKTIVGVALVAILREMGVDVTMMTPIATGGSVESAVELLREIGIEEDRRLISPLAFETAAAPYVASQIEKKEVDLDRVMSAYEELRGAGRFVVVEGMGAMVPITRRLTTIDLLKDFELPSMIVARTGRGTLNHCLLTLRVMQAMGETPLGFILNGFGQYGDGFAESLNPDALVELAEPVPLLATLEWRPHFHSNLGKFIKSVREQDALVEVLNRLTRK